MTQDQGQPASEAAAVPSRTGLVWSITNVAGRPAAYGRAGDGPPIVFLHGWALGLRAYRRCLGEMARQGMSVLAPALPGFGGTAELPGSERSLAGYAEWVAEFLETLGAEGPALVVGHSFGGGVAIRLAHDRPELVRGLVLVNSIGGSAWESGGGTLRSMAERPLWDWGIHFPADLWPAGQIRRVLPVVVSESVPNLLRHPSTFVKVADVARRADLSEELAELNRRRLPVVVLWGRRDQIITRASVDALCDALGGAAPVTVAGGHSWLLADPAGFGEVMTNVVQLADEARNLPSRAAAPASAESLAARRGLSASG
ncbi:MAG TPA: alpha/beta hydrolase [Acidimicrobiales bacterium]|nr:alpha/beta hydrolase [Acidimicrobiales bacterium]